MVNLFSYGVLESPNHSEPSQERAGERGIALLLVLWLVILLTLIVSEFAFTMRTEIATTANFKEDAQCYYLALAGLNTAFAEIMAPSKAVVADPQGNAIFLKDIPAAGAPGEPVALPAAPSRNVALGPGGFFYQIIDEGGKLNLSSISQPSNRSVLKGLFKESGLDDNEQIEDISNAISDWLDQDDDVREPGGAEEDWYEEHYEEMGFDEPYRPPNNPQQGIQAVEELLMIRGITPELLYGGPKAQDQKVRASRWMKLSGFHKEEDDGGNYRGFHQEASPYPPSGSKVNLYTASDFVIRAFSYGRTGEFDQDYYQQIIDARDNGSYGRVGLPGFTNISTTFTIISTGYLSDGVPNHTIKAVVVNDLGRRDDTLVVRHWEDDVPYREGVEDVRKNRQ